MIPLGQQVKRHVLNILASDNSTLNGRWRKLRNKYVKEKGNVCECCSYTKNIEVHHIVPRHVNPTLTLDWFNLIALCDDCHFHIGHYSNYKNYNPTIFEDAYFIKDNYINNTKIVPSKNKI